MKKQKTQILAALALILALGMVVAPNAAFAIEGAPEDEATALSVEDSKGEEGEDGDEKEALGLAESIAELYKRIQAEDGAFATFQKYTGLIENTNKIRATVLLDDATEWAKDTSCKGDGWGQGDYKVWNWLSANTRTVIEGKLVYEALADIEKDGSYSSSPALKTIVDTLKSSLETLKGEEVSQIKAVMPSLSESVDAMDLKTMVNTVEGFNGYANYAALYNALTFVRVLAGGKDTVSADALKDVYDEATLMRNYNAMAVAAVAIDAKATEGLYTYTLPTTGAGTDEEKPKEDAKAPASGIVGLIESGALDMTTVTLIAAVAVAALAGVGVMAKLWLKRKF